MQVTLRYKLSEDGRKAALLAGEPATTEVERAVEVEDLAPLADVLDVAANGTAAIGTEETHRRDTFNTSPTVEQVAEAIRAQRREQAAKRAAWDAAAAAFMADPEARADYVGLGYHATVGFQAEGFKDRLDHDNAGPVFAEANRREKIDRDAREAARKAEQQREWAEREAKAAAEAAEREAKLAGARAWNEPFLAGHGDDSQRERFAAGLLPDDETVDLVREVVFRALEEFPLYVPMRPGDVCECNPDYGDGPCNVEFSSLKATEATAEEWERLRAMKVACEGDHYLDGAQVELRTHTGESQSCEHTVIRTAIAVRVQAGPHRLRRLYGMAPSDGWGDTPTGDEETGEE